jgi:hypothetical protein
MTSGMRPNEEDEGICGLSSPPASTGLTRSYIITQLPGALLLSKYKPRIVIPAIM